MCSWRDTTYRLKNEQLNKKQKIFRSDKHKVYTIEVQKIAFSYNDDKCFIMNDNIHTLTHGHYRIKELQNNISINNNVSWTIIK